MLGILQSHSILYVEDMIEIQTNVKEYLESYFATVYVASDGKEALILYRQHHPDVLLLDINIPYISGLEVAKEVRKTDEVVKIVMLTAHTEKDKLLAATELKLTKYLVKPIEPKLFKETLLLLAKELQKNPSRFIHLTTQCIWDKTYEVLYRDDAPVNFHEKEFRLFKFLLEHRGKVVSYEDIIVATWANAFEKEISADSVKNLISHLRQKLPQDAIDTIYAKGYLLK